MEIVNVNIDELVPNTKNPRKISRLEQGKLIRSLKEFGFVEPIIVNQHPTRKNMTSTRQAICCNILLLFINLILLLL